MNDVEFWKQLKEINRELCLINKGIQGIAGVVFLMLICQVVGTCRGIFGG